MIIVVLKSLLTLLNFGVFMSVNSFRATGLFQYPLKNHWISH